jgi:hypothetical protein
MLVPTCMITDPTFALSGVRVALRSIKQMLFLDYDQVSHIANTANHGSENWKHVEFW